MYARWLVGAESLAVAAILYCAHMSDSSHFDGAYYGFDGPPESELSIIWRLRAREATLFVMALWVSALLMAYARTRTGDIDYA
jgi:hypothetical protein